MTDHVQGELKLDIIAIIISVTNKDSFIIGNFSVLSNSPSLWAGNP